MEELVGVYFIWKRGSVFLHSSLLILLSPLFPLTLLSPTSILHSPTRRISCEVLLMNSLSTSVWNKVAFPIWPSKFYMIIVCQVLYPSLAKWRILCPQTHAFSSLHRFAHTSRLGCNALLTPITRIPFVFQRWVNCSLQDRSGPLPVLVNKVLLGNTPIHSFLHCL